MSQKIFFERDKGYLEGLSTDGNISLQKRKKKGHRKKF